MAGSQRKRASTMATGTSVTNHLRWTPGHAVSPRRNALENRLAARTDQRGAQHGRRELLGGGQADHAGIRLERGADRGAVLRLSARIRRFSPAGELARRHAGATQAARRRATVVVGADGTHRFRAWPAGQHSSPAQAVPIFGVVPSTPSYRRAKFPTRMRNAHERWEPSRPSFAGLYQIGDV